MRVLDPSQKSRRSVLGLSDDDEINKEDFDKKIVTNEPTKSLNEQLSDPTFKSSTRILILVLLAQARRMSSVELRTLVGLGKGSLENHLGKLEGIGYVTISNARSMGGRGSPLQTIEITSRGLDACRTLVKSISSLAL